jgi:hypothetical protein
MAVVRILSKGRRNEVEFKCQISIKSAKKKKTVKVEFGYLIGYLLLLYGNENTLVGIFLY